MNCEIRHSGKGALGLLEPVRFEEVLILEDGPGRAVGDDPAAIDDDGAGKDFSHKLHIVSAYEHGLFEPAEEVDELPAAARIEAHRRLIEDDEPAPRNKGLSECTTYSKAKKIKSAPTERVNASAVNRKAVFFLRDT